MEGKPHLISELHFRTGTDSYLTMKLKTVLQKHWFFGMSDLILVQAHLSPQSQHHVVSRNILRGCQVALKGT